MAVITLTLNGERRTFDGDPETPLLWVLRDRLELTGTKYALRHGPLRSVHGARRTEQATRSCQTPMSVLEGKTVMTIEGLAAAGREHPLQTAWKAHNVPQCGYCQSGQIMQAAALLASTNGRPTPRSTTLHGRQPVPVRHLPAHPRRHQGRRREEGMNAIPVLSRRAFLGYSFGSRRAACSARVWSPASCWRRTVTPGAGPLWQAGVYLGI